MTGNNLVVNGAGNQQQSRYLTQAYANMAGIADLADDTFVGMNPLCGCAGGYGGSSIFGQSAMYGMNGMNGMYGYGPGSEVQNMSQIDYLKYQEQLEDFQMAKAGRQARKQEFAEFASTAADDVIARQVGTLQRQIKNNEQDHVMKEYNKLLEGVKDKFKEAGYTKIPEDQIKAHAERLYYETTGKSITDDLTENGDSPIWQGIKQGFGCGLGSLLTNKKNYKDNIAEITGEEKSTSDKVWQGIGAILTGGLTVLGIFGAFRGVRALRARP